MPEERSKVSNQTFEYAEPNLHVHTCGYPCLSWFFTDFLRLRDSKGDKGNAKIYRERVAERKIPHNVPENFRDTYSFLEKKLDEALTFFKRLAPSNKRTLFSIELLTANSHRGRALFTTDSI